MRMPLCNSFLLIKDFVAFKIYCWFRRSAFLDIRQWKWPSRNSEAALTREDSMSLNPPLPRAPAGWMAIPLH
jgi:hypothetical protein